MFLSGINFTLLLLMFNGKIKKFLHDAELKFYFICVSFFTLFIASLAPSDFFYGSRGGIP